MPPKKRGWPAAAPEPVASDDNVANQSDQEQNSEPGSDSGSDVDQGNRETEYKFFNTTFSTFRVSPLYVAQNTLTPGGLETLSRRLRDTLVGDVVRGVQVGLEGENVPLGRLGSLMRVEWRECHLAAILPSLAAEEEEDEVRRRRDVQRGTGRRARDTKRRHLLCLEIEYERATFSALMLPSLDEKETERGAIDDDGLRNPPSWTQNIANSKDYPESNSTERKDKTANTAFAHYPLLLTRMPATLKSVLLDFLSSAFDCRISALRLGTRSLVYSWERWIGGAGAKALGKDVALTLGFHLEPPSEGDPATGDGEQQRASIALGLKTIDVVVPSGEVHRFLRAGRKAATDSDSDRNRKRPSDSATTESDRLRRRKLGGARDEEGWWWIADSHSQTPNLTPNLPSANVPQHFTTALATYLDEHLALDLFHPGVRVLRVVCDAFALSEGGRVKVFAPGKRDGGGGEEVEVFVRDLLRRAQGRDWGAEALRLAGLEVWG